MHRSDIIQLEDCVRAKRKELTAELRRNRLAAVTPRTDHLF